jgi:hypothetical protein
LPQQLGKACGKNSAKAGEGRLVPMFPKAGALRRCEGGEARRKVYGIGSVWIVDISHRLGGRCAVAAQRGRRARLTLWLRNWPWQGGGEDLEAPTKLLMKDRCKPV